ncbi:unnamed protein product [Brassica oleracea var. botrytis]
MDRRLWRTQQSTSATTRNLHGYDTPEKKLKPVPLSHDGSHTEPWYLHGFSGNEGSADTMHDVLSKVPPFRNTSTNVRIGSPPSARFKHRVTFTRNAVATD